LIFIFCLHILGAASAAFLQPWKPLTCLRSTRSCSITFPRKNQHYRKLFVFFSNTNSDCTIDFNTATSIGTIKEIEKPYIIRNAELAVNINSADCTSSELWMNMLPVTEGNLIKSL